MIRALKSTTIKQGMRVGARQAIATTAISRSLSTGRFASIQLASTPKAASWGLTKSNPARLMTVRGYADVVKVPDMAESITEGTLREFTKEVGDFVEVDEEIASIETDKIDVAVNAPFAGTITEFLAQPEDTVEVGQPLLKIEKGDAPAGGSKPKESKKSAPASTEESAPPKEEAPKQETPKQEQAAAAPKEAQAPKQAAKESPKETESKPATAAFSREENVVKMNRMRLRIAERLKESQNTTASLTTFNEVDMSAVMEMRKLYKDDIIKKTGVKIGFMGLFAKASTLAMRDIPAANASIEGTNMVFRDYVDISVAVATPKGLVTPVVRNAESLDVVGLEREIASLGAKARDGKLGLEDMAGGTFTISNGGVFGSLMGTPIINMPQCAVLGLHGVKDRPVAIDGKVEIRPMMYLALTYDHRILDGREAVTFLRLIKEYIEDPRKMLLA